MDTPFRKAFNFVWGHSTEVHLQQSIYKQANIKTWYSFPPTQRKRGEIKWLTENKATKHSGGKGHVVPWCLTEEVRGGQQQRSILYEHKLRWGREGTSVIFRQLFITVMTVKPIWNPSLRLVCMPFRQTLLPLQQRVQERCRERIEKRHWSKVQLPHKSWPCESATVRLWRWERGRRGWAPWCH